MSAGSRSGQDAFAALSLDARLHQRQIGSLAIPQGPLSAFNRVSTADPDEAAEAVGRIFCEHRLGPRRGHEPEQPEEVAEDVAVLREIRDLLARQRG